MAAVVRVQPVSYVAVCENHSSITLCNSHVLAQVSIWGLLLFSLYCTRLQFPVSSQFTAFRIVFMPTVSNYSLRFYQADMSQMNDVTRWFIENCPVQNSAKSRGSRIRPTAASPVDQPDTLSTAADPSTSFPTQWQRLVWHSTGHWRSTALRRTSCASAIFTLRHSSTSDRCYH